MFDLQSTLFVLLILCLLLACIFEFVNGFHDTANAVATVIYTNSLPPMQAVVWSGIVNFLGLLTGGVGVTMSIVGLLPVELLTDPNVYHTVAMSLAMLLAAITWNAGTWYFGLPSSSSHTLIGAILGIGFGYAMLPENRGAPGNFINWDKAAEIGKALLLSPLCGFTLAIVLMFILKKTVKNKEIFKEPKRKSPPPDWIRALLITTCTLVSFFHGRNDGQKGIGLVMIVLIAFLPSFYAVNDAVDPLVLRRDIRVLKGVLNRIDTTRLSVKDLESFQKTAGAARDLETALSEATSLARLSVARKLDVRKASLTICKHGKKLRESENVLLSAEDRKILKTAIEGESQPFISYGNRERGISSLSDFAPGWVMWMIALSLGLGTMIGWKRIVVTVGEKIGKEHLSYAQGASAELVASITIGLATAFKWPVSTTHVLSSGIAGAMVASRGVKNLQGNTARNILLAWVLTLPVSIVLSATLFLLFRFLLS